MGLRSALQQLTSMVMAAGQDIQGKADVIVTEIFDSELLGEGILPTMRHATAHLLKVDTATVSHMTRRMLPGVRERHAHRRVFGTGGGKGCATRRDHLWTASGELIFGGAGFTP